MDFAEQAALSESEHDGGPGAPQSLTKRHYESAVHQPHYERYVASPPDDFEATGEGGPKTQRDVSLAEQRAMRRFDREPVDLGHSGILVPDGVDANGMMRSSQYALGERATLTLWNNCTCAGADYQSAVSWSSHLDPLFTSNLERDAALSWQYFGSSNGFLRRYPGTGWPLEGAKEARAVHDFRTDDWFVQAASSSKDIVSALIFTMAIYITHCLRPFLFCR